MERKKVSENLKKDKQSRAKKNQGITLIALTVTIIIMLILAGVSIRVLIKTGLFSTAKEATNAYKQAEEEEIIKLAFADVFSKSILSDEAVTADKLKEELEKNGIKAEVTQDGDKLNIKVEGSENEYTVDSNTGEITSNNPSNPDNPENPDNPNESDKDADETIAKPSSSNLETVVVWSETEPKATVTVETKLSGVQIQISSDNGQTWKTEKTVTVESGTPVYVRYTNQTGAHGLMYKATQPILQYTIFYDGNGATSGSTANSIHQYNQVKNLTKNGYRKTGYTFNSWNTKADGTGNSYNDIESVTNLGNVNGTTIRLYAQWTENQAVETEGNYRIEHYQMGVNGNYSQQATEIEYKKGTVNTTATSEPKTYTGFVEDESKRKNIGASIAADGSTVLQYYYTRNKYSYTIEQTEGVITTGSSLSKEYYYGADIIINAITKPGYTWNGWTSSNESLVPNITEQSKVFKMPAGSVTMTPNAQKEEYTIEYNLEGGTLPEGKSNPEKYTATSEEITLVEPEKEGYTFIGWTEGTGSKIYKEITIPQGSTGNKTYTAHWEINQYAFLLGENKGVDTERKYTNRKL